MNKFKYIDGNLYCEDVDIHQLASKVGTPFYLYSQSTLHEHYMRFASAFSSLNPLICYSIKSCSNLHIIKLLSSLGAGMDVVSGGELFRAIEAGVDPQKIVFAGVGKSSEEIEQALNQNIGWINIESEEELRNVARIASAMRKKVSVAIRINPDVYDPRTHQKTTTGIKDSKFGIDMLQAKRLYTEFVNDEFIKLTSIHIHIGSPIYSGEPYERAILKVLDFIKELESEGVTIDTIDIGGGYIAHYTGEEEAKSWTEYADKIVPLLESFVAQGGKIILEPGRSISANAGILIAKVLYKKQGIQKKFVIVNTGMSHLIRPAFYDSFHFIWPVNVSSEHQIEDRTEAKSLEEKLDKYDIVGPICESSDFLAKDRPFPPVEQDDLIAVFTAGAYGISMASQYNSIARPPEILVSGSKAKIIKKRETYNDLISLEKESQEIM